MFDFRRIKKGQVHELETLIVALKKIEKPQLGDARKNLLKSSILTNIAADHGELIPSSLQKLGAGVHKAGTSVKLPVDAVAVLKERLLDFIEKSPVFGLRISPVYRYFRTAVSGVLLLVFAATAVFVMPFQVPLTRANSTYLDELYGEVQVLRDGHLLQGKTSLALQEGDVILTRERSFVTVHFLDDSLGRLGENTALEIRRLYSEPLNPVVTNVNLFLKEGRLWTRVVSLIDDRAAFTVETEGVKANVSKKAAFDLYAKDEVTKIAVFDNVVDLTPTNADDNQVKTVVAGYQAEITDTGREVVHLEPIEPGDPSLKPSTYWIASNMARDEEYNDELVADAAASVLHQGSSGEEAAPVLSHPEIEKEKLYFMEKYGDLIKAETMFVRGNHKAGLKLLRGFRRGVQNILLKMPKLHEKDAFNADLLRGFMKEKVSLQLKDMAAFLPGDKMYPVKESLEEIALILSEDDVVKTQLKLSQAEGKLLEIQELLKEQKLQPAAALLRDYQKKTEQLVLKLDEENASDVEARLVSLVTQQVQQIKVLTAIEQSLQLEEQAAFREEVTKLRQESLGKLLAALDLLHGSVPGSVLIQLKDIFDTYLAGEEDAGDLIAPAFEKLLRRDSGLSFIQPDGQKIPAELGVVVIVSVEATPDPLPLYSAGGKESQN